MAGVDVIVLPSSAEGMPQVLVQAAMVGVPFVAYDVDGVRELVALGAAGAAVPLGDVKALARALRWALDQPQRRGSRLDEEEWRAWSIDVIGERYRARYAADLARVSGRRGSRGRWGSS
jgi:glycosyltransferase involved in cell wall biosynthesis